MDPSSEEYLINQKEGAPLNTPEQTELAPPLYIWNETEDPDLPMDPDNSLAARVCDVYMAEECKTCREGQLQFLMASTSDFSLKQFTKETYERDAHDPTADVTYAPVDASNFPNVKAGAWTQKGYPTLIAQAESRANGPVRKTIKSIGVEYDATEQEPPGKLHVQLGTGNTPGGMRWDSTPGKNLDVQPDTPEDTGNVTDLRPARPVTYAFFREGVWHAHRAYITDSEDNAAPADCAASINRIQVGLKPKNTDWTTV